MVDGEFIVFTLQSIVQPLETLANLPHGLIEPSHLLLKESETSIVAFSAEQPIVLRKLLGFRRRAGRAGAHEKQC